MPSLDETIRAAQIEAGERAVVQSLHDKGICSPGCQICTPIESNMGVGCAAQPPSIFESVLTTTQTRLDVTLDQRGAIYGDFTNNARVAQMLRDTVRMGESWGRMTWVEREALDAIILKISRIVTGDPHYPDNWHDIGGFARLAEDRCPNNGLGTSATS